MANKYWTPKTDNVDDILAEDFNNAFAGIEADMGDIETALDEIIAIQNRLIGGGTV
jgi:hypothetical protein